MYLLKIILIYLWKLVQILVSPFCSQFGWYDICHPVAVVQYTFTHNQYTEQHNETEYTEQNIHNIRNI